MPDIPHSSQSPGLHADQNLPECFWTVFATRVRVYLREEPVRLSDPAVHVAIHGSFGELKFSPYVRVKQSLVKQRSWGSYIMRFVKYLRGYLG